MSAGQARRPRRDAVQFCGATTHVVVGTRDRDGGPLRTCCARPAGLSGRIPVRRRDMNAHTRRPTAPITRDIARRRCGRSSAVFWAPRIAGGHCDRWARVDDARRRVRRAGELVRLMRRDGVDASGLEPGIEFADFARSVLDVPIQAAAVDAAAIPAESQDLVTMYHALEHVPDPLAVLTTVRTGSGTAVIWSSKCPTSPRACRRRTTSITTRIYHFTGSTLARWGRRPASARGHSLHRRRRQRRLLCFGVGGDERRPPAGLEAAAAARSLRSGPHTAVGHYLQSCRISARFAGCAVADGRKSCAPANSNRRGCRLPLTPSLRPSALGLRPVFGNRR